MKINKHAIIIGKYSISWGFGGSTSSGDGVRNWHIFFQWPVGNGDDSTRGPIIGGIIRNSPPLP